MKLTLLDMTQSILSAMDSDEVNSISDTTEARQVAEVIKKVYMNILGRANLPEHNKLYSLTASNDPDQPTLMYKPESVAKIEWIKYDGAEDASGPEYHYVTILPITQFTDMVLQMNPEDADVGSLNLNDNTFYFKSNSKPTYCTIVNDNFIIFDSYNSAVDTTLQESKTLCYGRVVPTFQMTDSFIPDLDDNQFPLLLNEATAWAFLELKQVSHDLAMLESRRQWRTLQKDKYAKTPNWFDQTPNFGRRV